MTSAAPRPSTVFWWGLLFEFGLGVLAWGGGWWLDAPPLAGFRWDWWDAAGGLLACVPMLVMFFLCLRWPVGPLRGIKDFTDEFVRPLFAPCSIPQLALIAVAAGVGEETLFRGLLQKLFGDWLGPWPGILLASILFGIMHLITVAYAVLAALMGLYLSWVMMMTHDNILSVMIAHGVYDFLALVVLVRSGQEAGAGGSGSQ